MKKIIRKRTNANGTSLWSDDRTRVTGLAGGSRPGGSCSESRMGVGAFAFWATETFLPMCRIKNNVLVGGSFQAYIRRSQCSNHADQKTAERRLMPVRSMTFSVSNFLKLFDQRAP